MGRDLDEALRDFNNDSSMFAGIVTGNGRAFCAGADLKEMTERNARVAEIRAKVESGEMTDEDARRELAPPGGGGGGLGAFSTSPKPIIAAVQRPGHRRRLRAVHGLRHPYRFYGGLFRPL